jgi:acyl-CoA thioester hydrolase
VNRSTYRVIYGDTDQMGVVYYANYLAWFERGRCEYMRERAFDYGKLEAAGYILPVVEATCRYKAPAKFDDLVVIETKIDKASRITITFSYRILREDSGVETILAEGTTIHACLTKAGKPVRWPADVAPLLPHSALPDAGLA